MIYTFLKRKKRIEFPIYNIPFDAFDLGNERNYYFVLHPTMEITDVFIAESAVSKSTLSYFHKIRETYLETIVRSNL